MTHHTVFDATPRRLAAVVLAAAAVMTTATATGVIRADDERLVVDITNTALDELYELDITTLSRSGQRYQESAAALFVLTHDDLLRAGVTSIPEALRLVPGVQVAKVDSSKWAVSIRGFSGRTSNKLLVMIDGRSLYNPLFAGVLWETRDVSIDDVDRIEVIRGPGGTLWGANAVNGVINIITRNAAETQGTMFRLGTGDEEQALIIARHGREVGHGHARAYVKYFSRDEGFDPAGDAADDWNVGRVGFRADWHGDHGSFTLSGDAYDGEVGERSAPGLEQDVDHSGHNVVFRWNRDVGPRTNRNVQFYYDRTSLDNLFLGEVRNTFNVDFQQEHRFESRRTFVWGLGHRHTEDDITNSPFLELQPPRRTDRLSSAFVHGMFPLSDGRLRLSVGAKAERNDHTGTELQPSARLAWTPRETVTAWGAISHAVRTPSRLELDLVAPIEGPLTPRAETLDAYETGVRWRVGERLVIDSALFLNDYDRLVTLEGSRLGYEMFGRVSGVELNASWQASPWWRVDGAVSLLDVDLDLRPASTGDTDPRTAERGDPESQFYVRNVIDLGRRVSFDVAFRYTDEIVAEDVPSYSVFDVNVVWRPRPSTRVALRGRNLLGGHHAERRSAGSTEVEPDVFFNVMFEF